MGLLELVFDRRAIDLICSTTAVHLWKILRVYEKGVSNRQVFHSAGIDPVQLLLHRVENKLDWMPDGAGEILQAVRTQLQRIRDNLYAIIEAGECSLTVHTAESTVSCPVCGLYFANESGLTMHIKSKRPEVHDASRVEYVKSKHAINGLPQCFFCQKILCDNHSLEKHITMGGCVVVKAALGKGQSIAELEKEICAQHQSSPPEVPEPIRELNQSGVLLKDRRPMYFAQRQQIPEFAESIHSIGPRCVLCGQILLDKSRIKMHWRKSHPAWKRASAEAMRICGSLKSVFRSPCQFCNSNAKNLSLHANQCSSLFQVCAGMLLSANNDGNAAEADAKTPQVRRSATVAA